MAKSESVYSESSASNQSDSVFGKDVSGKKSDYQAATSVGATGPTKNKLHDYTSYTYRITLFFLTKEDYNNLAASPSTFEPKYSLISSAGGYAATSGQTITVKIEDQTAVLVDTVRHKDFRTDFFIDNLQLTTVVGLNAKTKASNSIDISFNIVEPYGLSLLDRLLSACETSDDKHPSYMSQPYLLQIDLLANPTDEQLLRKNQTNNLIDRKRIAIKLQEMKIKPTGSGTTYAIRAIPYNHTAFNMTVAAVPVPFNIEAGTVGEFFGGAEDIAKLFDDVKVNEERVESELKKYIDDVWSTGGTSPTATEVENRRRALRNAIEFKSKSFTAAYNVYMESISKDLQLTTLPPTKIAFNIAKGIVDSPIVDELAQNSDARLFDPASGVGQQDPQLRTTQSFSINRGTSIIDVIDLVMGKSDYIKNQLDTQGKLNDANQSKAEYANGNERVNDSQKPKDLKWYKIVPTVALNDFDFTRNNYSKTILYNILPYTATNAYHPNFPKGTAQSVSDSVVRTYDYLYTGKNQDIIKLDIDFDNTYYTQISTYRNQVARAGQNSLNDQNDIPLTEQATSGNVQIQNPPVSIEFVGSLADSNSMNTATNPKEKIIADLKKSIYTTQRGDALNIKLQILGDPGFIKQDDVYYNPGSVNEYSEFTKLVGSRGSQTVPINPVTGQVYFDMQQIFVQLNFKNAVDINDSIGIVNKQDLLSNGRSTDGTFSGIYKVLTVHSEFNRGQFTQTLDLVRMPDSLKKPIAPATNKASITQTASGTDASDFLGSGRPRSANGVAQAQGASNTNIDSVIPVPSRELIAAAEQTPQYQFGSPANANNEQNIAPQNTAGWTFQDAFTQARKDFGNKPGGVFEWRGKLYQTNYQNEPYVANPTPVYPGANQ